MTLERRKGKALTIAFMHDELNNIIKQRYAAYSRGSCLWSGNTESVTVFGAGGVKVHQAGSKEYDEIIARAETKVHYSIYFTLAEWTDDGAEIIMPDGFGLYRIRTTSYNTVSNLINQHTMVKRIWRGPFDGIPFELTLTNRAGNGPDGKKRNYPVFTFTLKPRDGELRLTSGNFRQLVESGNRAAAELALPAPGGGSVADDVAYAFIGEVEAPQPEKAKTESIDDTLMSNAEMAEVYPEDTEEDWGRYREEEGLPSLDADDADDAVFQEVSDKDLKQLEQNKDQAKMTRLWHATVKGSFLDSTPYRADFLARHVDGLTSLKDVVGLLKTEQFDLLIVAAQDEITEIEKEDAAHDKLKDPRGWHESITARHARQLVELVQLAKLKRTEVYPFISMIIKRHVSDRAEVSGDDVVAVLQATGTLKGETWTYSEARASDKLMDFASWQASDESVTGVL